MGSTARTQAPACPVHYKGRDVSGCSGWGVPCPAGFAPGAPAYLLQPLQAPSQLTNLPPQGAFILFRFPNWDKGESLTNARAQPPAWPSLRPTPPPITCHAKDAGTGWRLRGLLCAGAPVCAQHQVVGAATSEAACRVEAMVRAEGDASPTFIHI